jgi:hypothetical protein
VSRDDLKAIATIAIWLLVIAGVIWLRAEGPCWLWSIGDSYKVPARCLTNFKH